MPAFLDFGSWFFELTALEMFYVVCAGLGTAVFVTRLALLFLGTDSGGGDVAHDLVTDTGDTDAGFQLLSIQGLGGFFLMFGLVGIALLRADFSEFSSMIGSFLAGALTLFAVAALSRAMVGLQSSGNIDLATTVGANGTVYLTVPSAGTGQVQITAHNRLRTLDAISQDGHELKTGTRVKVVAISGSTLVVEKA